MLSAGSPVFGCVMATRLRQVSVAQPCTRADWAAAEVVDERYAGAAGAAGAAKVPAEARPAVTVVRPVAATAVAPTRSCRRVAEGTTIWEVAMGEAPIRVGWFTCCRGDGSARRRSAASTS